MNSHKRKGFTLMELVVVIAILAILGLLLYPQVAKYLESSKQTVCRSNSRTVYHEIMLDYSLGKSGADILTEYNTDYLTERKVCPSGGVITVKEIPIGFSVHCSQHGYVGGVGANISWTNKNNLAEMMQQLLSMDGLWDVYNEGRVPNDNGTIDSSAPEVNNFTTGVVTAFEAETGIKISDTGATSWSVQYIGKGNYYLYWTVVDINTVEAGEEIVVMRYNSQRGTYTAGAVTVTTKVDGSGTMYKAMAQGDIYWTESNNVEQTSEMKKDFNQIYDVYQEILKQ